MKAYFLVFNGRLAIYHANLSIQFNLRVSSSKTFLGFLFSYKTL